MSATRSASAVLSACLAASLLYGHGASRGLHLHVTPDPAAPRQVVTVEVNASAKVRALRVGFVDRKEVALTVDPPSRTVRVELRVPEAVRGGTINLHAEAVAVGGEVLRASAVLRVKETP